MKPKSTKYDQCLSADLSVVALAKMEASAKVETMNNSCLAEALAKSETTHNLPRNTLIRRRRKRATNDENVPTNFFYNCRESSTNRPFFMQNKPNYLQNRPNVSSYKSKGYENEHRFLAQKSQSQFSKRRNEPKSF